MSYTNRILCHSMLATALGLLGCGTSVVDDPNADHRSGTGGSDAGAAPGSADAASIVPLTCYQPDEGIVRPPDQATLAALLTGRWILCRSPSVFGTWNEVGTDFHDDRTWSKLYLTASGAIEPGRDFGDQGQWDAVETVPGSVQLNLTVEGAGVTPVIPTFAAAQRKMRLTNAGVSNATYTTP